MLRLLHSADSYACLIITVIPRASIFNVSHVFLQLNGPRATIAHHAVFAVASHPTKENIKILEGMCDAYEGAWETVKTRACDRISDSATAAMITAEMFERVDNILENA